LFTVTFSEIAGWILAAALGGSGLVGLLFIRPRRKIERSIKEKEDAAEQTQERLKKVDELAQHSEAVDKALKAMATENTLQCYCLLACLKGLAEQGCDGPVHDAINKLEKYLNQKAHGEVA